MSSKKDGSDRHGERPETTDMSRKDWIVIIVLGVTGMVTVLFTSYLAFSDRLRILQPRDRKVLLEASMSTFAEKLAFTSKYWILPAIWLHFNLHLVMNGRRREKAANPLSGDDHKIQGVKNILGNTIEQLLLQILLQITTLHYLTPVQVMNIAPLFNALFLIGRILFWLGYPKRRTLGFAINIAPCVLMIAFTGYKFVTQHLDMNCDSLFHLNL